MRTLAPSLRRAVFQFVASLGVSIILVLLAVPLISSPVYVQIEGAPEGQCRIDEWASFSRNWLPDSLLLAAGLLVLWGLFMLLRATYLKVKKDARHFVRETNITHTLSITYTASNQPHLARDRQEHGRQARIRCQAFYTDCISGG